MTERLGNYMRKTRNNPKVLGFIDIGKMADEKMTADVKAVYDAGNVRR